MSDLKLGHKKPCKDCPFLKTSIAGYFGQYTPKQYLDEAHGESGVVCHNAMSQRHACVGALQHATASCKIYKNPWLAKMQRYVGPNPAVLNYLEFIRHHSTGNFAGERKEKK